MKHLIRTFAPLAVALPTLWSCGGGEAELKAERLPAKTVQAQKVALADVPRELSFPATLAAKDRAELATRIMGTISELSVKEGQRVAKGQVLARIASADIQAQREQAEARLSAAEAGLESAKADYDRIKALFDKKSATRKELDDATAGHRQAQAQVRAAQQAIEQAKAQLAYATVRAPFAGTVVAKRAEAGGIASPGMPLLVIEAAGDYEARASVPEGEIGLFSEGDEVEVRVEALGVELAATVARVNPAAQGAQYEIVLKMQPEGDVRAKLKSGMYAEAVIQKGVEKRLMVEEQALVKRGQLEGVFLVSAEQEALLRWVRTGKRAGGKVEILSGVAEGETVVTGYEGRLQDGQKVRL